jgi:hypothetical protein
LSHRYRIAAIFTIGIMLDKQRMDESRGGPMGKRKQ